MEICFELLLRKSVLSDTVNAERYMQKANYTAEEKESLIVLAESVRFLMHEIKNPLTAISFQCEMLRDDLSALSSGFFSGGADADAFQSLSENINVIEEQTERIKSLTRSVNDFFVDAAGRDDRVDLVRFLNALASSFSYDIGLHFGVSEAFVVFDREKLRSVLENVIKNAIESVENAKVSENADNSDNGYSAYNSDSAENSENPDNSANRENACCKDSAACGYVEKAASMKIAKGIEDEERTGRHTADNRVSGNYAVEIFLTRKERTEGAEKKNCYVVEIIDRGRGIPEGIKERVFEPFFTTKKQGSGIGLFLARRFVESRGGAISLENCGDSETVCRIELPCAE